MRQCFAFALVSGLEMVIYDLAPLVEGQHIRVLDDVVKVFVEMGRIPFVIGVERAMSKSQSGAWRTQ